MDNELDVLDGKASRILSLIDEQYDQFLHLFTDEAHEALAEVLAGKELWLQAARVV